MALGKCRGKEQEKTMYNLYVISIVIPTWNGAELLRKNLPSVLYETEKIRAEVIVVDDGSDDETEEVLSDFEVKVIRNKKPSGFVEAANRGVISAKHEWVLLLNNDIKLKPGFVSNMLDCTKDDVFAIGSSENGVTQAGYFRIFPGVIGYVWKEVKSECVFEADFVSAGHSLFSRKKLFELGLFNRIYSPGYFEDIEACWRARREGWKVIVQPKADCIHPKGASMSRRFSSQRKLTIHRRNWFLFMWRNMPSRRFVLEHIAFMPAFMAYRLAKGDIYIVSGFLEALKLLR